MMKKTLLILFFPFILGAQQAKSLKGNEWVLLNRNVKERTKKEAKQFIDSIKVLILKGYSFPVLAALCSEDPGSSKMGGQLPPFTRGQMVPEFEVVAFKLPIGTVSEVFETKYGYHILEVFSCEKDKISARHILIGFK